MRVFILFCFILWCVKYIEEEQRWNKGEQLRSYCSHSDKGGPLLSEKRLGFQNLFRRVLSGFAGGFDVGVRGLEEFFCTLNYSVFGWTGQNSTVLPLPHLKQTTFFIFICEENTMLLFWMLPSPALLSLLFLTHFVHHFSSSLTCFGLWHLTWFGISPSAIALGNFKTLSEANLGVAFSEKSSLSDPTVISSTTLKLPAFIAYFWDFWPGYVPRKTSSVLKALLQTIVSGSSPLLPLPFFIFSFQFYWDTIDVHKLCISLQYNYLTYTSWNDDHNRFSEHLPFLIDTLKTVFFLVIRIFTIYS